MKSIGNCSDSLALARQWLDRADPIVVGAGAGLSASGGLNYGDAELVRSWFPEYYAQGARHLMEIAGVYWQIQGRKEELFWGYWARHILHIRYETPLLKPYADLARLMEGRDCFVITTNADGQFFKALPRERIFAPQGGYGWLQCETPCCDALYDSEPYVRQMAENMPNALEIRTEDIPRCPRCGARLVPNLRMDDTFVETPHLWNLPDYQQFLEQGKRGRMLLLELGVGFNTPVFIRYPFEAMAKEYPDTRLIRINLTEPGLPEGLEGKALSFAADIGQVIAALLKGKPFSSGIEPETTG